MGGIQGKLRMFDYDEKGGQESASPRYWAKEENLSNGPLYHLSTLGAKDYD